MMPLNGNIRSFMAQHPQVTEWEEAHVIISGWLATMDSWTAGKGNRHFTVEQPHSSATPMDIGAVPTTIAAAPTTPKPAPPAANPKTFTKVSPAVYWADKTCNACGLKGHGSKWAGCTRHPDYQKTKPKKTYAAATGAAAPPPPETTHAASTSAAQASELASKAKVQELRANPPGCAKG
jgi:hypothetical protein